MNALSLRQGRVVDAHGSPVPGALIAIAASTVPMPEIALRSDDQGRFSLRLPPGRFTLRAHGPDGSTGEAEVDTQAAAGNIVIALGRSLPTT